MTAIILTYLMIVLALLGTLLVARFYWQGWVLWIISDVGFFIRNVWIGETEQAILWAVYCVLAVQGLVKWLKRRLR